MNKSIKRKIKKTLNKKNKKNKKTLNKKNKKTLNKIYGGADADPEPKKSRIESRGKSEPRGNSESRMNSFGEPPDPPGSHRTMSAPARPPVEESESGVREQSLRLFVPTIGAGGGGGGGGSSLHRLVPKLPDEGQTAMWDATWLPSTKRGAGPYLPPIGGAEEPILRSRRSGGVISTANFLGRRRFMISANNKNKCYKVVIHLDEKDPLIIKTSGKIPDIIRVIVECFVSQAYNDAEMDEIILAMYAVKTGSDSFEKFMISIALAKNCGKLKRLYLNPTTGVAELRDEDQDALLGILATDHKDQEAWADDPFFIWSHLPQTTSVYNKIMFQTFMDEIYRGLKHGSILFSESENAEGSAFPDYLDDFFEQLHELQKNGYRTSDIETLKAYCVDKIKLQVIYNPTTCLLEFTLMINNPSTGEWLSGTKISLSPTSDLNEIKEASLNLFETHIGKESVDILKSRLHNVNITNRVNSNAAELQQRGTQRAIYSNDSERGGAIILVTLLDNESLDHLYKGAASMALFCRGKSHDTQSRSKDALDFACRESDNPTLADNLYQRILKVLHSNMTIEHLDEERTLHMASLIVTCETCDDREISEVLTRKPSLLPEEALVAQSYFSVTRSRTPSSSAQSTRLGISEYLLPSQPKIKFKDHLGKKHELTIKNIDSSIPNIGWTKAGLNVAKDSCVLSLACADPDACRYLLDIENSSDMVLTPIRVAEPDKVTMITRKGSLITIEIESSNEEPVRFNIQVDPEVEPHATGTKIAIYNGTNVGYYEVIMNDEGIEDLLKLFEYTFDPYYHEATVCIFPRSLDLIVRKYKKQNAIDPNLSFQKFLKKYDESRGMVSRQYKTTLERYINDLTRDFSNELQQAKSNLNREIQRQKSLGTFDSWESKHWEFALPVEEKIENMKELRRLETQAKILAANITTRSRGASSASSAGTAASAGTRI